MTVIGYFVVALLAVVKIGVLGVIGFKLDISYGTLRSSICSSGSSNTLA